MNILGTRQSVAVTQGQILPPRTENSSTSTKAMSDANNASSSTEEKMIDMRNISPNDYNELVRFGVADLPVPMVLPNGRYHLNGEQANYADVKTDYIGQIEQAIEFNKQINDTAKVEFLTERLTQVLELHGNKYRPIEKSKGLNVQA